jgi:hypothetical protein
VANPGPDNPPIHRAVQAARKAAGFDTAAAAASHFGWSLGRYRSHESGARNIPDDDINLYARSFKVPIKSLRAPDRETITRQLDSAREAAEKPKREIAHRLRCARILRGLKSAIEASRAFGVATPTYLKHENAGNEVKDWLIEFYAAKLSISSDWLLSGRLPTGLGVEIDARIHQVLKDPERFVDFATTPWLRYPDDGEQIALGTGRPAGVVSIPEYRWSHLAEHSGNILEARPHGVIDFPGSPDPGSVKDILSVFSVLVDINDAQLASSSRIFVTQSFWYYGGEAEYLTASGRQLAIVKLNAGDLEKTDDVLGRVIGKMEGLRHTSE